MSATRSAPFTALLSLTAAATLGLACIPVSAVFSDSGWVSPTLLTIALVCAVGGLLRALRVPIVAIPGVQAAVVLVTMAYYLQPTPTLGVGSRLAAFRDLVSGGLSAADGAKVPVASTPQFVAVLVLAVFVAALLVENLAVGLGVAAGAGAVLLAMAAVPVGLAPMSLPRLAGPAVGWLLLMAADQWARLSAHATAFPAGRVAGPGVGLLTIMAASLVGSGVLLAVVAPTPSGLPWLLSRPDSGGGGEDLFVDIRAQLQAGNREQEVLTYRSSDGRPSYLGMATLERFTGESFAPWPRTPGPDSTVARTPGGAAAEPGPTFDLQVATLTNPYLPLPDHARVVTVPGTPGVWTWDRNTDDVVSANMPASGVAYQVETFGEPPSPAGQGVADVTRRLPLELQSAVEQTAREVTAGSTSNYDRALKLQEWFAQTGGFVYSLTVPDPGGRDPVVAFLTDRQGFCQQYATAMAVLARSLQIPARVVVGFASGSQRDDGSFLVTGRDAHAWPQLWFNDLGWVRFEPTPATANPALGPPASDVTAGDATPTPTPVPSSTPAPADQPAQSGPEAQRTGLGGLAPALVAGCILVVLAFSAPGARRRRSRSSRLADLATGDAVAAWAEIRDTALDAGLAWATGATTRQQAADLVAAIGPPPGEAAAWPALRSVVAAVEERLYAPAQHRGRVPEYRVPATTILGEPWLQPGPNALVADVEDVLGRLDDIPRPLSARLFPRSLRRPTERH